jgi:hypothetical protein
MYLRAPQSRRRGIIRAEISFLLSPKSEVYIIYRRHYIPYISTSPNAVAMLPQIAKYPHGSTMLVLHVSLVIKVTAKLCSVPKALLSSRYVGLLASKYPKYVRIGHLREKSVLLRVCCSSQNQNRAERNRALCVPDVKVFTSYCLAHSRKELREINNCSISMNAYKSPLLRFLLLALKLSFCKVFLKWLID